MMCTSAIDIFAIYHLKAVAEEILVRNYLQVVLVSFQLVGVEEQGHWNRRDGEVSCPSCLSRGGTSEARGGHSPLSEHASLLISR